MSSVSSVEDLSDSPDNSSEDDADDEEDPPAPACHKDKGRKSAPKPAKKTINNRNKKQATKKKKKAARISDDELYDDDNDSEDSSDDVYAAVDYISDGDGEDQDMEKLEEMMILESESESRIGNLLSTADVGDAETWAGPTNIFDDHMLLTGTSFFDEDQLYSAMENFGETDLASEAIETPMQVPRHVHFEAKSESSSDSDSHTEDEVPGDFLQQDSLDPQLRRMIEHDNENTRKQNRRRMSNDDMFGESDYGHSNIYHVESDAVDEKSESSGYESMTITHTTPYFLFVLTEFPSQQPMMARLQMKTYPRRLPSHIPGPFCAVTHRLPLLLPQTRTMSQQHAGGALLWDHLCQILTNRWLLWTAPASISSSFRLMPPLVMTG